MSREISIRSNSVSLEVLRWRGGKAEVLLLQRTLGPLQGCWCHVAGGVEEGETVWQAAVRELQEETGLTPWKLYTADFFERFYRADWDALVLAPVLVAIVPAEVEVRLNAEHSEYRWCSWPQAMELLPLPAQRACVTHVWTEFVDRPPHPLLEIKFQESAPSAVEIPLLRF